MSYGGQIALRAHADLEAVASATPLEVRPASEDQFLERLRRGEAAAFEQLVAEHSSDVYALLFRLTSDAEEARDLTQETFLRTYQNVDRFRGDASLKTWIYRIAINQARNRWRWWKRRKRDVTISLDATDEQREKPLVTTLPNNDDLNPEQEALAREREGQLREALLGLRHSYREAVILRDVEVETHCREPTRLTTNVIERDLLDVRVARRVDGESGNRGANVVQHAGDCRIRSSKLKWGRKIRARRGREVEHVRRAKLSRAVRIRDARSLRAGRRSIGRPGDETKDALL